MHIQLIGLWIAVGLLTALFLGFVTDVYRQTSPDALNEHLGPRSVDLALAYLTEVLR